MNKHSTLKLLSAALLTLLVTSGSALALKATSGLIIYNDGAKSYTTTNPKGCPNVTFPTPIKAKNHGVVSYLGSAPIPCTSIYTNGAKGESCTVTLRAGKLYASAAAGATVCQAINDNSAVKLY